ncbi:MAG: DUF4249 domain-containing protein [Melioribacteraceae bacterium]|nr:DUF4249 domain-containing protein [Melioribacteraceae bacterium]
MKKLLLALPIIFLLIVSCEDSFDPYGELENKYIFNCVLRGDTTFQTAYLSKSYMVDNYDPYSNSDDATIKNAQIRIWEEDNVALFRDTTVGRNAESKYKTPFSFYYTDNYQPKPGAKIEIEALLPTGKRLKSTTRVPYSISFRKSESDTNIRLSDDFVQVRWSTYQPNPVFIPRLIIYYTKPVDGQRIRFSAVVPLNYIEFNGQFKPNYAKPNSDLAYGTDMKTFKKAMELISDGIADKSSIVIFSAFMEVYSLDENLSTYYNATARTNDAYSVKLTETDFSNVLAGTGIFGVFVRNYYILRMKHDFINSFGYTPGLSDVQ